MLLFTSQFDLLLPLPISFELKYEKARFSNDPISFLFFSKAIGKLPNFVFFSGSFSFSLRACFLNKKCIFHYTTDASECRRSNLFVYEIERKLN